MDNNETVCQKALRVARELDTILRNGSLYFGHTALLRRLLDLFILDLVLTDVDSDSESDFSPPPLTRQVAESVLLTPRPSPSPSPSL